MEKTLFSTPELAQWLGVFHTTVRRWIEKGKIKGIRVGRNYKIPADEVIRILNGHGIPLPDVVRGYVEKQAREGIRYRFSQEPYGGSILQKLLVVEEIDAPAFVCRKRSILGGNRHFAELVGVPQADLIGMDIGAVLDERSSAGLMAFAKERVRHSGEGPAVFEATLRTGPHGKKSAKIAAGSLDHLKDVYLLIVTEV